MVEVTGHHPMMEEMFGSYFKEDYMLFRELPRILIKNLRRLMDEKF